MFAGYPKLTYVKNWFDLIFHVGHIDHKLASKNKIGIPPAVLLTSIIVEYGRLLKNWYEI